MFRCNSFTFVLLMLSAGCYASSTKTTPAGTSKEYMLLGGLVMTADTNTLTGFDRCRDLLKPGHPGTQPMIDRDVYAPCFNNAMMGVEPRGQMASPASIDTDGDGRPDVVRYPTGHQVPMNLFMAFPSVYWPNVYQYYGIPPGAWTSGPMSYAAPYSMYGGMPLGPAWYPPPAPPGPHINRGSIADPLVAGYIVANAQADAIYPEVAKNPQDFARRSELHTVVRQTRKFGNALTETRTDLRDHLQDHKKGDLK